jgi:4-aminobutyrate aminotransferase-like enzyme
MIKRKIVYDDFSPWKFDLQKAKGSYLWTKENKRLLDFTSGWNVTNLGWNHPEIKQAVAKQARTNAYAPMWTAEAIQDKFAEQLTKCLPKELNTIARATGGTEANEEAIKTARAYTGRKKILGFKDTYHGQSLATMSLGFPKDARKAIGPTIPKFVQMNFPNSYRTNSKPSELLEVFSKKLEKILSKRDVAAVVTEIGIVTGSGSCYVAPKGYLQTICQLTNKYGTLMILDEVGTGFSRCGRLFGLNLEGIVPDIVTFAKGISNGAGAIGAMVTKKEIAEKTSKFTTLVSTFGWTPINVAAALKTLEIHIRDKVWRKAENDGYYTMKVLQDSLKENPFVGDIRGKGMEIGVDLVIDKKTKKRNTKLLNKVINLAFEKGLHLVGDGQSVIQIMPPLTTNRKDLDKGLSILTESIMESSG